MQVPRYRGADPYASVVLCSGSLSPYQVSRFVEWLRRNCTNHLAGTLKTREKDGILRLSPQCLNRLQSALQHPVERKIRNFAKKNAPETDEWSRRKSKNHQAGKLYKLRHESTSSPYASSSLSSSCVEVLSFFGLAFALAVPGRFHSSVFSFIGCIRAHCCTWYLFPTRPVEAW